MRNTKGVLFHFYYKKNKYFSSSLAPFLFENKIKERNSYFKFFIIAIILQIGCSQTIIHDCASLSTLSPGSQMLYVVNQSFDCTGFNFQIQGNFNGTIDGRGNTISNLIMPNQTGPFFEGYGMTLMNLVFLNVVFGRGNGSVGLASTCSSCTFVNVTISTSSNISSNVFYGLSSGAFVGGTLRGVNNFTGCIVENTLVNSTSTSNPDGGGGFVGLGGIASFIVITYCFNLGFAGDANRTIVSGNRGTGGLIGVTFCKVEIFKSGVERGVISSNTLVGGLVGLAQCHSSYTFSETYVSENVTIISNSYNVGGLVGSFFINSNGQQVCVNNSYSKASVLVPGGNDVACLVGSFCVLGCNTSVSLSDVYTSCTLEGTGTTSYVTNIVYGNGTGNIVSFSNVFYNNLSSTFPAINGNSTGMINPIGMNCSLLWNTVAQGHLFDQSKIWNGDKLRIEYYGGYGSCSCSQGCPVPTTNIPTTNAPTTNIPSTNFPSKNIATTNIPTTVFLTSTAPTTNQPSTYSPSTHASSISLSNLPHTSPETTSPPFVCFYRVTNCQFCPQNAPLFDLTQGNVSCIFFQNEWRWTFIPNNGTLTNTGEIVVSGNTTTFVEGNFVNNANLNISSGSTVVVSGNFSQELGGQIVFTFNPQQNNNKSSPLNVGGCVSINGNISLNLQTQPQQGTTNFQVISYNCSQQVNISSSQIQVIPNYNASSCDTINSQTINQPGSLGLSITSTLGNKCNEGKNLGLVIGLSVGIPLATILILATIISISIVIKKQRYESALKNLEKEMKTK